MPIVDLLAKARAKTPRPFSKREMAWAAILFETAQSDRVVKTVEIQVIADILQRKFRLTPDQSMRLCERQSRDTRRVSARASTADAIRYLGQEEANEVQQAMWEVARSDLFVAEEEEMFIATTSMALGASR